MKKIFLFYCIGICSLTYSQEKSTDLGDFKMSSDSSPAFLLVEESPTLIYTTDNLKALVIHGLDNFGESISIEVAPYFFIGTKSTGRTYYKYMGVEKDSITGNIKQYPFRGLNTTNISFAYVNKEFEGIEGKRKTFSIGIRTTLLRFYNKDKLISGAVEMAGALANIAPDPDLIEQLINAKIEKDTVKIAEIESAIKAFYEEEKVKNKTVIERFKKTTKPFFRLDGAFAYSSLFKENSSSSDMANRFGTWLTAAGSLLLNEDGESAHNNYISILLTGRYIEDGFNVNTEDDIYFNKYYRDFGGKIEFEFGKFTFGYEYISRIGTVNSERSVGNIKFTINENLSISGGFGKDFPLEDNLITTFGVNWGLNLGNSNVSF